jgi:D-alanyl-D-alanine carboxypeptidase
MEPDNNYTIPESNPENEVSAPRRFPAVIQLGLLGVMLVLILGTAGYNSYVRPTPAPLTETVQSAPLVTLSKDEENPTSKQLSDVKIRGQVAYVYDVKAKKALYQKNPDTVVPLASITKLMTALLTHELIADDKIVTVTTAAVSQSGSSGLTSGERFTSEALRDYALLSSSNGAAYALAAAVGSALEGKGNPADTFVAAMNVRAEELGLSTLKFYNPTGLDISTSKAGAYGSARDVTFLMEYIVTTYPSILEPSTFIATRIYDNDGAYHDAENTNPTIARIPNLLGSKTGYTDLAGGNLTIAFDAGFNRPIIITVLGSTYDERFSDVLTLVKAITGSIE